VRPLSERACDNRSLQFGLVKKLRLSQVAGKGWGVFAAEQVVVVLVLVLVLVVLGYYYYYSTTTTLPLLLYYYHSATTTLLLPLCYYAEQIMEGEFVVEYVGEHISLDEAERRAALSPLAADYMMELPRSGGGGGADLVTIDAYAMRNVAACINF